MIINKNILAILRTFSNLPKKIYETLYTKKTASKVVTTEFLSQIPKKKKISNEQFNLSEAKISLDEIIKSTNFQTNESPGNDSLTGEFYKNFSNELAPILLDLMTPGVKLCTVGVTSRTGIRNQESVIYKKGDKKDIANYRLIHYKSKEATTKNIKCNNK